MTALKIEDLDFAYPLRPVLKDLNLEVQEGDLILIVGENGCGKSTLLKVILGELKPQAGKVEIFGKNIHETKDFRDIAYVPQMNVVNQIPFPITCMELVVLNLYRDFGFVKRPKKEHYQKAEEVLKKMDLEKHTHVPFNELSGGLQQRVMIARAMINKPRLLVLDEPTASVDKESKEIFYRVLRRLKKEENLTVLMVSHEIKDIEQNLNIDHIYRIKEGAISHV